jgi:hypothetical protein
MKQLTKHEIEEIYRRLPELESKIADALLKGEPLRLTTEQILKDVEA